MQTLYLYAIEWDTDSEDDDDTGAPTLPQYVATNHLDEDIDLADELSDRYGFCVNSLNSIDEIPVFINQK